MAKGKYQIPFSSNGDLLNYASHYDIKNGNIVWKDNYSFQDELEYYDFAHGRSSVQLYFKSINDGRRYNMSLSDFSKCILKDSLVSKRIKGEFTFAKKGTNYMLVPIFSDKP